MFNGTRYESAREAIRNYNKLIEHLWDITGVATQSIDQPLCTFCRYHDARQYTSFQGPAEYDEYCDVDAPRFATGDMISRCGKFQPEARMHEHIQRIVIKAYDEFLAAVLRKYTETKECPSCKGAGEVLTQESNFMEICYTCWGRKVITTSKGATDERNSEGTGR